MGKQERTDHNEMKQPKNLKYVDVQKRWRKIGPIAKSDYARQIWLPDMLEFHAGRQLEDLRDNGILGWVDPKQLESPSDFDYGDGRFCCGRRGPLPAFWDYTCGSACHWLVNLNLFLASVVIPKYSWRIVTSKKHSTVWNGNDLLFDMNYIAFSITTKEAWKAATLQKDSEHLEPGDHYDVGIWSGVVQDFNNGELSKEEALELRFGDMETEDEIHT